MTHTQPLSKQPSTTDLVPWHPETILDIRNLDARNLPVIERPFIGMRLTAPDGGTWRGGATMHPVISSDILVGLEDIFIHCPFVGFSQTPDGILTSWAKIPTEVKQ